MSLRHFIRWPSIDIHVKFYGDRPRGTPPSGELNTKEEAAYSDLVADFHSPYPAIHALKTII